MKSLELLPLYLGSPYVVALKVEADAHVLVVGVHLARRLAVGVAEWLACLVQSATASDIVSGAIAPLSCRIDIGEEQEISFISQCYYRLLWTTGIWSTTFVSVQFEVLPSFGTAALASLWHELTPFLSFVGRDVAFQEAAINRVPV